MLILPNHPLLRSHHLPSAESFAVLNEEYILWMMPVSLIHPNLCSKCFCQKVSYILRVHLKLKLVP